VLFEHNCPSPVKTGFFFNLRYSVAGLHNASSSLYQLKHGARPFAGFGSMVMIIFMAAPHFGHCMDGRFVHFGSSLYHGIRKTT
jgi:hypothetical protein